jgi:Flp pilus assembly protein TadG
MKRWIHTWREYWNKRRGARGNNQEGQSLIEMAFAFPVLVLLVVAVIDFARIFDASIVLTNAVREGARYGSKDESLSEAAIKDIVVGDVHGSGTNVTMMADFAASHVTVVRGAEDVTVTAAYDFGLWFGGLIGRSTVHLERTAVMPRF